MTSGMMIGRGKGRDQFGAGNGEGSSRKRNDTEADIDIRWKELRLRTGSSFRGQCALKPRPTGMIQHSHGDSSAQSDISRSSTNLDRSLEILADGQSGGRSDLKRNSNSVAASQSRNTR
jgi:hypothetical protein